MNHRTRSTRHPGHRLAGAAALLFAAGLFAAPAARADLPDLPSPLQLHREVRAHLRDVLGHLERVPERIHDRHVAHLRAFAGGSTLYAPHRHRHVVYRFPVWIDGRVDYRPYSYCDGRLFGAVSVRPPLWVDWSHQNSGAWCGHCRGYYPNQHSCFQRPRQRYGGQYDYNRGWDARRYRDNDGWRHRRGRDDDRYGQHRRRGHDDDDDDRYRKHRRHGGDDDD